MSSNVGNNLSNVLRNFVFGVSLVFLSARVIGVRETQVSDKKGSNVRL